jgi:hypothetical protein
LIPAILALLQAGAPCPELPLAPGTTWTYHAVAAWTAPGDTLVQHDSLVWRTRIVARRQRDSVVVATVQGWPSELAWWAPGQLPATSLIVCLSGRVYHVTPDTASLRPLADSLLRGRSRPSRDDVILQFPLRPGTLFGRDPAARPDAMYAWDIEQASAVPAAFARWAHGPGDSLYTLVYRTLPDHQIVAFIPYVGVVDYVYSHHGTVANAHAWLTDFH